MGSIAGIVYPDVFKIGSEIQQMLGAQVSWEHQQPDIHQFYNIKIGLCGEKLTWNEHKTIVVGVYGFIDNQENVRKELSEDHGIRFSSHAPSELILNAYEVWGPSFIDKINGEWAILILDQKEKKLYLFRGRIGQFSLYWYYKNKMLIFGSELKSILASGLVPATPCYDSLATFFYFGYIPQDLTAIKDVNKLLPGHFLKYDLQQSLTIENYWSFSKQFSQKMSQTHSEIHHTIDKLLESAVKVRVPHDIPVGCFLTGGLGSASVAYYLNKFRPKNEMIGFNINFQGQTDQEALAAQQIAQVLQIPYEMRAITPKNFLDDLVPLVWYLDEPIADPMIISTWRYVQLAASFTKDVFSGMTADEVFSGHLRYINLKEGDFLTENFFRSRRLLTSSLIKISKYVAPPLALYLSKQMVANPWQIKYIQDNALFNEEEINEAFPPLKHLFDPKIFLYRFNNLDRIDSLIASLYYLDFKTRLPDCYILQYSKLTQVNQLNWKTPYFDRRLIEYLAHLPQTKYFAELEKGSLLKALIKKTFPSSVLKRKIVARKNFLKSWMRESNLDMIFQLLSKGTLVDTGIVSEEWLAKQNRSIATQEKAFPYLWAILILEIWFRLFINQRVTDSPQKVSVRDLLLEK